MWNRAPGIRVVIGVNERDAKIGRVAFVFFFPDLVLLFRVDIWVVEIDRDVIVVL